MVVLLAAWALSLLGTCFLTAWVVRRMASRAPQVPGPEASLVELADEPPVSAAVLEEPDGPPGVSPVLVSALEFYDQCQATLAQGVIDHLGSTTTPFSENLLKIKTDLDALVAQIRQGDHEVLAVKERSWLQSRSQSVHADMSQAMALTRTMNDSTARHFLRLRGTLETILQINTQIADISDRTHILAINASIEAARAGAAGRGFQVIANQVKSMAVETATLLSKVETSLGDSEDLFQHIESDLGHQGTEVAALLGAQRDNLLSFERHYLDQQARHDDLHGAIMRFSEVLDQRIGRLSPVVQLHEITIQELENLFRIRWKDFAGLPDLPPGTGPSDLPVRAWAETVRAQLTTAEELQILDDVLARWGIQSVDTGRKVPGEIEFF